MRRNGATVLLLVGLSVGLPGRVSSAQETRRPIITLENASRLHVVHRIPHDAYRILNGPSQAQFTMHGFNAVATPFDWKSFRADKPLFDGVHVVAVAFSPDGNWAAWSENSKHFTLVDKRTGKALRLDALNPQPSLAFRPDSKALATGGYGTTARIWDLATAAVTHEIDTGTAGALWPVYSKSGRRLAIGNRNGITAVCDGLAGDQVSTLSAASSHELAFSPDERTLSVGYVNGTVGLWNPETGALLKRCEPVAKEIYTLDWSPKGDLLATSGLDSRITLWNPEI